jgi:hypothetical protein
MPRVIGQRLWIRDGIVPGVVAVWPHLACWQKWGDMTWAVAVVEAVGEVRETGQDTESK